MMSEAVALGGCSIIVQDDRALTIEVRGRLVGMAARAMDDVPDRNGREAAAARIEDLYKGKAEVETPGRSQAVAPYFAEAALSCRPSAVVGKSADRRSRRSSENLPVPKAMIWSIPPIMAMFFRK